MGAPLAGRMDLEGAQTLSGAALVVKRNDFVTACSTVPADFDCTVIT